MRRYVALTALLAAIGLPLFAQPAGDPPPDLREQLAKLQSDPQQYARLKASLAQFRRLPPERQEAIRRLDRDLHSTDPIERGYLERALERYADWLDQLPPADRDSVVNAPDRKTRLQRIRALREQQWLAQLPKATRDQLDKADPKTRADRIKKLHQEERDRQADWEIVSRHRDALLRNPTSLPSRYDMLPEGTKEFVDKELRPVLSREDEKRLEAAEGQWPRFPRLLVELADDHPPSVLGPIGPTRINELPQGYQEVIVKVPNLKGFREKFKEVEGKWPEFGVVARDLSDKMKAFRPGPPVPSKRQMPAEPKAFTTEVQDFIHKKLLPALDDNERRALQSLEGVWPAYPRSVLDLSRKHDLRVPPGKTLPGQAQFWDRYRMRPTTALEPGPARKPGPLAHGP